MQKEIASTKIRSELRKALIKEAEKDQRTLSWYIEAILEEYARKKKIKV